MEIPMLAADFSFRDRLEITPITLNRWALSALAVCSDFRETIALSSVIRDVRGKVIV
jgi:hypothetical protein